MKRPFKIIAIGLLLPCCFISCARCKLQLPGTVTRELSILSYNVQNLFDDVDNGTEYSEFDPTEGEWSTAHFHTKCIRINEVITAAIRHGPDIVALQEVENENALDTLRNDYLKGKRYIYSALVPSSGSAVNVAVLSRFPITEIKAHQIYVDEPRNLRNILECWIAVGDEELVIFNNHWKSKLGGAEETEQLRIEAAGVINRRCRDILSEHPAMDIVIVGDFNESVDEYGRVDGAYQTAFLPWNGNFPQSYHKKSLSLSLSAEEMTITDGGGAGTNEITELGFFSCWADWKAEEGPGGSYYYKGGWETIDNIFLTSTLFDDKGVTYESFSVVENDFLLNEKGSPFRWDSERKDGYSDHLPLLATFSVEEN